MYQCLNIKVWGTIQFNELLGLLIVDGDQDVLIALLGYLYTFLKEGSGSLVVGQPLCLVHFTVLAFCHVFPDDLLSILFLIIYH